MLGGAGSAADLDQAAPDGLVVLARAHWPAARSDELPALPGFVVSSFNPLVAEVAQRCLSQFFGEPPVDPARGERIAVVLVSPTGDIATASAVAAAVDQGRRVPPMLFYQSNLNAVVGFVTARWGLAGPVVCVCPSGDPLADASDCASLAVADGDADAVLVVIASQGHAPGTADQADAFLAGPPSWAERS
jgi:Beta-ketoacyl synthase, N-terminal domain